MGRTAGGLPKIKDERRRGPIVPGVVLAYIGIAVATFLALDVFVTLNGFSNSKDRGINIITALDRVERKLDCGPVIK